MILSDRDIRSALETGRVIVEGASDDIFSQIWPSSLDFRLGNVFKSYRRDNVVMIDPSLGVPSEHLERTQLEDITPFVLHPRQFVLGVTREKITLGRDIVARCEGRSSLGRLGLIIHSTAGFIDPGFSGNVTLEITNINEVPILLYPGMRIGQFAFETLSSPAEVSYAERKGSKYMLDHEAQESRSALDRDYLAARKIA